ncbi:MAG TPA: DegV family protein [Dehalococcoidia bacterium]|nr:DegV family protein [Dehalococcoidia bacterium]
MNKIAIIADTVACLPREMVEQYGIEIVAPNIYFDGRVYRDWLDITPSEAYQLLEEAPELFRTSPPAPMDFVQAYHKLSTQAESILCILVSSKMSTFCNVALLAKEQVKEKLPHTNIEVLDSQTATGAEGFIVLAAARAAAEGKGLKEAIEAAQRVKEKVSTIFVLETIRHAYRTGRIPKVAAQVGGLLSVKPMLAIRDGVAHFNGMTRSKEKGVNCLLKAMHKKVGKKPVHVVVNHTDALEEGERLRQQVRAEFDCVELWLTEFSPLMGYATGRGTLGLAFYAED